MKFLPWSIFNALGQSSVVRSSYIWVAVVPILAKVLSLIPEGYILRINGMNFNLVLGVPFSWEILYYAAIFFAVGSLCYQAFCPDIVKRYGRYSDFAGEGKGGEHLVAYSYGYIAGKDYDFPHPGIGSMQILRFLKAHTAKFSGIDLNDVEYLKMLGTTPINALLQPNVVVVDENKLPAAFWFVRDFYDRTRPLARLMTLLMFASGFCLVFYILIQNFIYVFSRHFY